MAIFRKEGEAAANKIYDDYIEFNPDLKEPKASLTTIDVCFIPSPVREGATLFGDDSG